MMLESWQKHNIMIRHAFIPAIHGMGPTSKQLHAIMQIIQLHTGCCSLFALYLSFLLYSHNIKVNVNISSVTSILCVPQKYTVTWFITVMTTCPPQVLPAQVLSHKVAHKSSSNDLLQPQFPLPVPLVVSLHGIFLTSAADIVAGHSHPSRLASVQGLRSRQVIPVTWPPRFLCWWRTCVQTQLTSLWPWMWLAT